MIYNKKLNKMNIITSNIMNIYIKKITMLIQSYIKIKIQIIILLDF